MVILVQSLCQSIAMEFRDAVAPPFSKYKTKNLNFQAPNLLKKRRVIHLSRKKTFCFYAFITIANVNKWKQMNLIIANKANKWRRKHTFSTTNKAGWPVMKITYNILHKHFRETETETEYVLISGWIRGGDDQFDLISMCCQLKLSALTNQYMKIKMALKQHHQNFE